jgi:hypothetical protein
MRRAHYGWLTNHDIRDNMSAAASWQYFFRELNAENQCGPARFDVAKYRIMRISRIVDARQLVSAVNCLDSIPFNNYNFLPICNRLVMLFDAG